MATNEMVAFIENLGQAELVELIEHALETYLNEDGVRALVLGYAERRYRTDGPLAWGPQLIEGLILLFPDWQEA